MGLAEKIRENHELAAATQQALRNGRRVIRRIAEVEPISLPAVIETQPLPSQCRSRIPPSLFHRSTYLPSSSRQV